MLIVSSCRLKACMPGTIVTTLADNPIRTLFIVIGLDGLAMFLASAAVTLGFSGGGI